MAPALAVLAMVTLSGNPPELGDVRWLRSYRDGLAQSRATGKPVLLLFDEVPGCSTVNAFAREVLSNPLLVDASAHFIPVAVFNNEGGDDAKVLKRWNEPSWNNPVLRFIDADEKELAPRLTHDEGLAGLLAKMNQALGARAPAWLSLAATRGSEKVSFGMYCFWEGEAKLGAVPGVAATRAGFEDGREVVEVTVAPGARAAVEQRARALGYAPMPGRDFSPSKKDDKYQLQQVKALEGLELTEAQRTRVNSAIGLGEDWRAFLAPSQLKRLSR